MKRIPALLLVTAIAAGCSGSDHAKPSAAPASPTSTSTSDAPSTTPAAAVTQRRATVGTVDYTLTLQTPDVAPHDLVRMTLRIANRGNDTLAVGACPLIAIGVTEGRQHPRPPVGATRCVGGDVRIRSARSFTFGAHTTAPATPGTHLLSVTSEFRKALPPNLLEPFDLHVSAPAHAPRTHCIAADLRVRGPVGMPTPVAVTQPMILDLGTGFPVDVAPPGASDVPTVTAEQAWKRFSPGWIPISPLGRYQLLLGRVSQAQLPGNPLAWILVARHAPQPSRTNQTIGPTGSVTHDCFFTDGITGVNAVGNTDGIGLETGTLTIRYPPPS